jgi:predicted Zn-dependent protease
MIPGERLDAALAAARAAGADDCEVCGVAQESHFVRFASSRFTQVGELETVTVRVRALVDGRLGSMTCDSLAADRLAEAARGAVAAARVMPPLDVPLTFGAPAGAAPPAPAPPALPAELTARGAPAGLAAAFARARRHGATCAGALKTTRRAVAVRTAAGLARAHHEAHYDLGVIATGGDSSGYAGRAGSAADPLDVGALVERAAEAAARGAGPIELEPGAYDVVLSHEAVAELIEWMSFASFGAAAVLDGTSLLAGRAGEPLCDPAITIRDRAEPGELGFDAEGTPRREVLLSPPTSSSRPAIAARPT